MRLYIASSWKNQHGVEMLTALLRAKHHEVISWIENNFDENPNNAKNEDTKKFDFEEWVESDKALQSFRFDTEGAANCDVLIYYGPAGKDAAAECGIAYAKGIPMIGLAARGEDFGLMRKMFITWCHRYHEVIDVVEQLCELKDKP